MKRNKKQMNIYSPNMLKTFDECQQKYFLRYIKKMSLPQCSDFSQKGKRIHALASYFLGGDEVSKLESVLSEDEKNAWDALKKNRFFNLQIVKSEYNISCKVGKNWVGGRLDALMKDSSAGSKYYILDYKTGNLPKNPRDDFQTIVYLLCVDKLLKSDYAELSFVYIGLKKNEEVEVLLDVSLKKNYEDKILKICEKIELNTNSGVFEKNLEKCKFCEYKKVCNREA